MRTVDKASVTELSKFPKTAACKTADGITIQGIGKTKHSSNAWDAKAGKLVEIPEGTIIALGGSMGNQRVLGTDVFVVRVIVHPYGPEICFRGGK
jgi:hypothetical protein